MGFSFGVSRSWLDLGEETLNGLQAHAQIYATEPPDWAKWLKLENSDWAATPHYSYAWASGVGYALSEVLAYFTERRDASLTIFVPYQFNFELCPNFGPHPYRYPACLRKSRG